MKFRFNLSAQIATGYLLMLAVAVVAVLFCFITLQNNERMDNRIRQSYLPLYFLLRDFQAMQVNSQRLCNNWVYQPNAADKQELKTIHQTEFPALKKKLEEILTGSDDNADDIREVFTAFELVILTQKDLINILPDDSAYTNDNAIDKAISLLNKKITPQIAAFRKELGVSIHNQEVKVEQARQAKQRSYNFLTALFVVMVFVFLAVSIAAHLYSRYKIVKPVSRLKDTILEISQGKIVEATFQKRTDEIGEMTVAIATLMESINARSAFAVQIGKGNYVSDFTLLGHDDIMGKALLDMRQNLKRSAEEEQRRNWAITGLATFAEIIRDHHDFQTLGDAIISHIVKYTNSNQGGLFVVNDSTEKDVHLQLLSCYAWDKKKFVEKTIHPGQGITGQCWLEGEPVLITQVPANYVYITSGLGHATPRCVFLVPLKINNTVYGVLELASFEPYKAHEREFIVKVCENIASSIAAVKVAEQTRHLLQLSQQQTEEMRSQEEEMRQNMEELVATQEEVQRILQEVQGRELYMRDLIDASKDAILTFDHNYKIIHINRVAKARYMDAGITIEDKDSNLLQLIRLEDRAELKRTFDRALAGEDIEMTYHTDQDTHHVVNYVPIRNEKGDVTAVAQFGIDVTVQHKTQQEMEKLLQESQLQAEILRAQEEELRQNMEELKATQEAEAKRSKELERAFSQGEAQKQMMIRTIEKLKEKEKESQAQSEELRTQEEELRAQQEELRQNMEELEATLEAETKRSKEMERMLAQMEAQKQMMNRSLERFKKREADLMDQLRLKDLGSN